MPVISTIFNGAAHVTVSGCIAAFLFKRTIVDRTSKAVKEAENVTAGLVVSELCLSMAVLAIASHKTARILLSNDTHQVPAVPKHDSTEPSPVPLAGNIISDSSAAFSFSSHPIATESSSTSTSTNSTPLCTQLLPSPVQRLKRLSIDSDTTLIDDDDFADDLFGASDLRHENSTGSGNLPPGRQVLPIDDWGGPSPDLSPDASTQTTTLSLSSTPSQIATPRLKLPDKKRDQSFRLGRHKHESRAFRLVAARDSIERTHAKQLEHDAMISQLEQLHNELVIDQAALVDGWAAAIAQLGLTSMLSPGSPLPHQKTPVPGNSSDIPQD